GFINLNADRVGCASARNKGTCHNRRTIKRGILEATVLDGLQQRLMDPALMEVFCEEYTLHSNKLRGEQNAAITGAKAELQKTTRELGRLVQAIIDGVPGRQVKDKMGELETRKEELEAQLKGNRPPNPTLLVRRPA
ncbi:MAG TPA: recombinase family protein, partial [Hyphomicrobiaceae bacterium]|nr:recombinase family protein [Hyphomicrobiaceae bacterium]